MTKIFSFWRIVIQLGLAKTGVWQTTDKEDVRIYLFTVNIIKRREDAALNIIIGPFSIMFGFVV